MSAYLDKATLRELVLDFYSTYDPQRLRDGIDISGMVNWTFENGLGELNRMLYQQYRAEIDPSRRVNNNSKEAFQRISTALMGGAEVDFEEDEEQRQILFGQLEGFYRKHDPSKLGSLQKLVDFAIYRGVEQLNEKLRLKYGEDLTSYLNSRNPGLQNIKKTGVGANFTSPPTPPQRFQVQPPVQQSPIFQRDEELRLAPLPSIPNKSKLPLSGVVADDDNETYLPPPPPEEDFVDPELIEEELKKFYKYYDPGKLDVVEALASWVMKIGRIEFNKKLVQVYGYHLDDPLPTEQKEEPKLSPFQKQVAQPREPEQSVYYNQYDEEEQNENNYQPPPGFTRLDEHEEYEHNEEEEEKAPPPVFSPKFVPSPPEPVDFGAITSPGFTGVKKNSFATSAPPNNMLSVLTSKPNTVPKVVLPQPAPKVALPPPSPKVLPPVQKELLLPKALPPTPKQIPLFQPPPPVSPGSATIAEQAQRKAQMLKERISKKRPDDDTFVEETPPVEKDLDDLRYSNKVERSTSFHPGSGECTSFQLDMAAKAFGACGNCGRPKAAHKTGGGGATNLAVKSVPLPPTASFEQVSTKPKTAPPTVPVVIPSPQPGIRSNVVRAPPKPALGRLAIPGSSNPFATDPFATATEAEPVQMARTIQDGRACNNYRLDMTGSTFGVCVCGHPRTEHRRA